MPFFNQFFGVFTQKYSGDITIKPLKLNFRNFHGLLSNPTHEKVLEAILEGERKTWPYISMVKNHCDIEFALDECVAEVERRVGYHLGGVPTSATTPTTTTTTTTSSPRSPLSATETRKKMTSPTPPATSTLATTSGPVAMSSGGSLLVRQSTSKEFPFDEAKELVIPELRSEETTRKGDGN